MGEPRIALRALLFAACIALIAALQLPSARGAGSPSSLERRADSLRAENSALTGRARAAWLSMVSLGTRLEQTRAALVRLRARTTRIRAQREDAELQLGIARRGLAVSQRRLATRLRDLYEQGDTDRLAVLLGARSIDDAITAIESLDRVAGQDRDFVGQARKARARLGRLARALAAREAAAREAEAATAATAAALAAARGERAGMLASLAAQRRSNASRISSLDAQARSLAAAAVPASPLPSVTGPSGTGKMLTVVATGYAMQGKTSTGVSVGYGVVAVDPNVIPLGTRMTIPGYGEGIAADTGGSVFGARIDLWFATRAAALAWGARTVTIALH